MKIFIYPPSFQDNQVTYLSSDLPAGSTSLAVKNTTGLSTTKFVILGTPGFEQAELLHPTTVTPPLTIITAATVFPHSADTKLTVIDYDQIKIYRSVTGIAGSYTLLATTPIQVDSDSTEYDDLTAQPTYYYKFSYLNSSSSDESDLSDAIAATGFIFYSLKTLIDRTLSLFGDRNSRFVTRDEVRDFLNELYEKAQQELTIATKRFSLSTYSFTVASGVTEYTMPIDFLMEKSVKVSKDAGVTFPYNATMMNIDSLGTVVQTDVLYGYSIYDGKMVLDPPPTNSTDVVKVYYVPLPTTLNLQTDTLSGPFINSSSMFVKYALGMCYLKDQKSSEWQTLTGSATSSLNDFITYIKRLQNSHPQFAEIMDRRFL